MSFSDSTAFSRVLRLLPSVKMRVGSMPHIWSCRDSTSASTMASGRGSSEPPEMSTLRALPSRSSS
jgi:hypothetical protein